MFPLIHIRKRRVPKVGAPALPPLILVAVALAVIYAFWADTGHAEDNLLRNGLLSQGKDTPDYWTTRAWQTGPGFSTFNWNRAQGEVEISSIKPNDASWIQKVHLAPGWYHFTASMRTEDVPTGNTGAYISVLEDGIVSDFLNGTNNWHKLDFYLKVGAASADVEVACRLGGFASLNTGKAACRDFKAVKVDEPPADARRTYELDVIRGGGIPSPPPGADNSTLVVALLAAAIALLAGILISRRPARKGSRAHPPSPPSSESRVLGLDPLRAIEIALFAVSLLTYAYFYQAADHSTGARFDLIRSILERHTLWIEGYAGFNTADIVQLRSHVYSNKAPGGSYTGIPPWLLVTAFLRLFLRPRGAVYWALATYLTTVLSVSLVSAIIIVIAYRFALLLGASQGRAVAVALTLAFGTILFPYATEFTAEPIAAGCVIAAFYLLALPQVKETQWLPFASGLLAGWAVLCDYPTFLLACIVALYAVWRLGSPGKVGAFVLGALAVAALLLSYNYLAFGNPLFLSYEAYGLPGDRNWFPEQAVGFAGVTYPRARLLWKVLFDPQRGLFFCNPVLLLTIPALVYFWRRRNLRAEFMVVACSVVVFALFNASYGESIIYWGGGTATGPRHMLSAVPFMALALVFLPDGFGAIFAAAALLSAFAMLMATAVEPHLPYEYTNPLRDFVWPAYLRGDLAYNKSSYFGGRPIAGDSVAFNLGKVAALPGAVQLLPLAAIWMAAAFRILRLLGSQTESAGARGRLKTNFGVAFGSIILLFVPPIVGVLMGQSQGDQGLLGRYYEGFNPRGFPPHILRVDGKIDFDDIAQLGALPPPSTVIWSGELLAPVSGVYVFTIEVDDAGWLKIDGGSVIADPGEISKMHDSGSIYLASGSHSIEVGERNIWGGASMHLFWQPPGGVQQIVPAEFLRPRAYDRAVAKP